MALDEARVSGPQCDDRRPDRHRVEPVHATSGEQAIQDRAAKIATQIGGRLSRQELQQAVDSASMALREIERQLNQRIAAARAEFSEALRSAQANLDACRKSLDDFDDAQRLATAKMPHPETTLMCEWDVERFSPLWKLTGAEGRYEIVTKESNFSAAIGRFRRPQIGDVIIRLLKKDGSKGLDFRKRAAWGRWLPSGVDRNAGEAA